MSKFISIPKINSFFNEDFIGYDEHHKIELSISIPIDKIYQIVDEPETGSLIDLEKGMNTRRYIGKIHTYIILNDGQKIKSPIPASQLGNMINEIIDKKYS
jgi:hypothetical protein